MRYSPELSVSDDARRRPWLGTSRRYWPEVSVNEGRGGGELLCGRATSTAMPAAGVPSARRRRPVITASPDGILGGSINTKLMVTEVVTSAGVPPTAKALYRHC